MALVEIQGFDHQNDATDLISDIATLGGPWLWSILTLSGTLLVPGRVTGGKALALGTTGIFGGTKLTAFAGDTAIVGYAVRVPSAGNTLIGFWDSTTQNPSSGTMQASVLFEGSTGIISIYRGSTSGTLLHATASNQFPRNSWFYFEVKTKIHASAGAVDIQIKGNPYLSLIGLNTQAGATSRIDGIFFGGAGSSRIDDLYIADTTTGPGANPYNDFLGTPSFPGGLIVNTPFATANGAVIDFTPLSGTNTSQVQEHAMDSDTTYNWDIGTVNDEDLFDHTALPVGAMPLAVKIQGSYREAGTGRLWQVVNKLRSGVIEFKGSPVTIFPSYTYQSDIYPQNPDGNVPWTKTSVDAAQIGYEITSSTIIQPPPPPFGPPVAVVFQTAAESSGVSTIGPAAYGISQTQVSGGVLYNSSDMIVARIITTGPTAPIVTGVSNNALLTFLHRGSFAANTLPTPINIEEWYAIIPLGLNIAYPGLSLTVNLNGAAGAAGVCYMTIVGLDRSVIFDGGGTLGIQGSSDPPTLPAGTTINHDNNLGLCTITSSDDLYVGMDYGGLNSAYYNHTGPWQHNTSTGVPFTTHLYSDFLITQRLPTSPLTGGYDAGPTGALTPLVASGVAPAQWVMLFDFLVGP